MNVGGGSQIVQAGYTESRGGGWLGNIPCDGAKHFVYTQFDSSGGGLYLADAWSNGAPTVGHRYRFKIDMLRSIGPQWNYCIRDLTVGGAYYCRRESVTWDQDGKRTWWGTENHNSASAMGPECCSDINMYWRQYQYAGQLTWYAIDHNVIVRTDTPHPSRWHTFVYNAADTNGNGLLNDQDGMKSHTDNQWRGAADASGSETTVTIEYLRALGGARPRERMHSADQRGRFRILPDASGWSTGSTRRRRRSAGCDAFGLRIG